MTPLVLRRIHARYRPRQPIVRPWLARVWRWLVREIVAPFNDCPWYCQCPACMEVPLVEPEFDFSQVPGVWSEGVVFWSAVVPAGEFMEVPLRRKQLENAH